MKPLVQVLAAAGLVGCASWMGFGGDPASQARQFVADYDRDVRPLREESAKAAWIQATHITPDTQWLSAKAAERSLSFRSGQAREARRFMGLELDAPTARQLKLLQLSSVAPSDPAELAELTRLASRLEALYGSGRYCPPGVEAGSEDCLSLTELERIIRESRNPDELLEAWSGWRSVAVAMKADYVRFAELQNIGARELGHADAGALWRAAYDMPAQDFAAEVERLWSQVEPLYQALHCHVRAELVEEFGAELVDPAGEIPAHLLGNMWAQQWGNLYPRMTPYPGADDLNVTQALVDQGYTAEQMVRQAEGFYRDIGFPALPDSFYQNSQLVKPSDREVVCHASAWDIDLAGDVRIKMCIEPDEDNLSTIYHELGHIYYDLAYNPQPVLFQRGAHDGFHEAVGDTMVLAMTPAYLQSVKLVGQAGRSPESTINEQFKMALDKVAFLPFGLLVDKWRWQVFAGEVTPAQYTRVWWDLKRRYQGVKPPMARGDDLFDPGAKFHIPGNTPYMRYFLAHILQFQFYEAMCAAAGHEGPLNECSFAGSQAAGDRLWAMLQYGQSQPWQDALFALTGTRQMDAEPLLRYFAPLSAWLAEKNAERACGW